MEISCNRRAFSKDIAVLRDFSVTEHKIMIDAIQVATLVTKDKSGELIGWIAVMGGTRKVDMLKSNIVYFNTRKHTNEEIYDNVEVLEKAIQGKR